MAARKSKKSPRKQAFSAKVDPLQAKLVKWIEDAGYHAIASTEPHSSNVFELGIEYGDEAGGLFVVRPKGSHVVGLVMSVAMGEAHMKASKDLTHETRAHLLRALRRTALEGGVVGFAADIEDGVPRAWELDAAIYDDGLSQNALMGAMRALHAKHVEMVDVLEEALNLMTTEDPGLQGYE